MFVLLRLEIVLTDKKTLEGQQTVNVDHMQKFWY